MIFFYTQGPAVSRQ